MDKYLEISNGSKIVIDDEFTNYSLQRVISYHDGTLPRDGDFRYGPADGVVMIGEKTASIYQPVSPGNLLAIKADGIIQQTSVSGVLSDGVSVLFTTKITPSLTKAYEFGSSHSAAPGELLIYNKDKEEIFNSNTKYLRVLDYIYKDRDDFSSFSKNYEKDIAVIVNSLSYHYSGNNNDTMLLSMEGGQSVSIYQNHMSVQGADFKSIYGGPTSVIVVDVSNY